MQRQVANILRELDLSWRAAAAAGGVRASLVWAWPGRAICGGRVNLARTGEATAPQWLVPLEGAGNYGRSLTETEEWK